KSKEDMKANLRRTAALAVISAACFSGVVDTKAATVKRPSEAEVMMSGYDAEQRAAALAREKDAAWKPACAELGVIQVGESKRSGTLKNFCLNTDGNILACYGSGLRVYSPKGELQKTLALDIKPSAVCVIKDGTIFAAGDGRLLKLDASGKVLAS